ncbi:MAG: oligosaccharide flippase family protein [Ignavibacteria bacterium]|nr:oligosaccharide flippase family protein [Ignavibacteria bacterium]
MKEKLKRLTADSAVYGISTILGRFLNFLLVPFYTNVFPAAEYGIVTVVYSYIAFLNIVYTFGLEPAYMRFLADRTGGDRREVFSTPLWTIAAAAGALTAGLLLCAEPVAAAAAIRPAWSAIVPLAALTLAVDALNMIPFASLRMERKSRQFALIRFASIGVNIALNLVFVLGLRMSIVSIFSANLIASLFCTLLLFPTVWRNLVFRVRGALLKDMLAFGLPTIPAGLAAMVVQVIDRPIMQRIAGEAAAGIYGANYRLGIIMMLVVTMFQYAWQPFFLQNASDAGAKPLFARVLTYFTLLGAAIVVLVSLFIEDLATIPLFHGRALLGKEYWSGLSIVPVVLFGYLWTGLSTVLNAGLLIEKRTSYLALVTGLGAAVNVAANLLLIPGHGLMGGALATLAAYAVMAGAYFFIGRRVYPVPWEYGRLLKIAAAFGVVAALFFSGWNPWPGVALAWKGALALLFPLLLLAFRFFLPAEADELRSMLRLITRKRQGERGA